jgi:hypothetical protein
VFPGKTQFFLLHHPILLLLRLEIKTHHAKCPLPENVFSIDRPPAEFVTFDPMTPSRDPKNAAIITQLMQFAKILYPSCRKQGGVPWLAKSGYYSNH